MNQYYCTNNGRDCPSCQPCGQSQQEVPRPVCPCTGEFRAILNLICSPQLYGLIDTAAFGFIGSDYLLGTALTTVTPSDPTPGDNLTELTGTFVCGSSCETVSAAGLLTPPMVDTAGVNIGISQAVLCDLTAIAFDAAGTDTTQTANFQTIAQVLSQALNPGQQTPCCNASAGSLLRSATSRTVTLTAGSLILRSVTVLGELGNVLALANSADNRFYLLCSHRIGFLG